MMSKLHSAIERFKEEQDARHGDPRPHMSSTVPAAIVYSRTRSVEIPEDILRNRRILTGREATRFTDAYKILRTQVIHRLRENQWNVLGVTSPKAGEGKTLTAINLAIALAAEPNQTVLLADADLRAPRVREEFGFEAADGLTEFLLDGRPLEEMLVHPGLGRLVVLPGGRGTAHSADVLTSPRMTALVKELKHRYPSRVVIFDLPPVLQRADVLALAPQLDALLLVVEDGATTEPELRQSLEAVKGSVPVLGLVLNKAGREDLTLSNIKRAVGP